MQTSKSQLIDLYLESEGIEFKSEWDVFRDLDPSKKKLIRILSKIQKIEQDIKKREKNSYELLYYVLEDRYYFHQRDLKRKYYQVLLDLELKGVICDLGCGMGLDAVLLAKEDSKRFVVGIDISRVGIKYAKQRALRHELGNIDFIVADMYKPPFRRESIDNYISSNALSLYGMTRNEVCSIFETLKSGRLVIGEIVRSYNSGFFCKRMMHLIEGSSFKIEDFYHLKWIHPSRGDETYEMLVIRKI